MTIFKTGLTAVGFVIALSGCGGDDNKGTGACSAFTPCGGAVLGTWDIKDTCVQGKIDIPDCPSATAGFDDIGASGTMTFKADMTGSATMTFSGGLKLHLPASCLAGRSCSSVEAMYKAELLADPDAPFTAVACTGTDPCSCTFSFKSNPMTNGGTYSTAGTILTQGTDHSDYCVAGNELRMKPHMAVTGMSNSMMNMDELTMALVMTRK